MKELKVTGGNRKTRKVVEEFLDKIEFEKWIREIVLEEVNYKIMTDDDLPLDNNPKFIAFCKKYKIGKYKKR